MKFFRLYLIALITLGAMNHLSWTQEAVGGTINGKVVDKLGEPMKDVKVTITNIDTQRKITCVTDIHGKYKMSELTAGNYTVLVEKDGYMFYRYTDLILTIEKTVKLNTTLEPLPPPLYID